LINIHAILQEAFMFFYIARSKILRWVWSRPGLMVPWAKMMLFNGRFKLDWWTLKEMAKQCGVAPLDINEFPSGSFQSFVSQIHSLKFNLHSFVVIQTEQSHNLIFF
jgi:hypothetical protein